MERLRLDQDQMTRSRGNCSAPGAGGGCLVDLERLTYFLFVDRAALNGRTLRFAKVMDDLDPRTVGANPSNQLQLSNAEKALFLDGLNGQLYRKTRVCKPVLQRLDEALSTGGAAYDNLVSIEHVLPQTVDADSEWASCFRVKVTEPIGLIRSPT